MRKASLACYFTMSWNQSNASYHPYSSNQIDRTLGIVYAPGNVLAVISSRALQAFSLGHYSGSGQDQYFPLGQSFYATAPQHYLGPAEMLSNFEMCLKIDGEKV